MSKLPDNMKEVLQKTVKRKVRPAQKGIYVADIRNGQREVIWCHLVMWGLQCIVIPLVCIGKKASVIKAFPTYLLIFFIYVGLCLFWLWKYQRKINLLSEEDSLYCIPVYLVKVVRYRGIRIKFVYWDYQKQKFRCKNICIESEEAKRQELSEKHKVYIVVKERQNKVQYVTLE